MVLAYRALYRAYRPQNFNDVAGQKHVTQTLKNAIKENRLAHAYLFCGPRGTGKTSIAKIFAKAINCENADREVPCNECETCKTITNGEHPDIIEIDAASNNGVDEVRNLIEKVKYAPILCKYKVYIIDEVHMMSSGAFNALLKTLEEPPEHVIFILATTEPLKVLPTIISRCQRFDFTRLSQEDIVSYLSMVLDQEGVTYETQAIELIASLADGGMRDSLSILEQCLAYSGKNLTIEDVNTVYGVLSTQDKVEFLLHLIHKEMASVLKTIENMNQKGIDLKRLTVDLIQILKDIIVYKNTNETTILNILTQDNITTIAPYVVSQECFEAIDLLNNALEKYRLTSDPLLYFELACMKIANSDTTVKVEKEVKEIKEVKVVEVPPQTKVQPKAETKQIAYEDVLNILVQAKRPILTQAQSMWPMIQRYISNENMAKYVMYLQETSPAAACKHGLILQCNDQTICEKLNSQEYYYGFKDLIQLVLNDSYDYIAIQSDQFQALRQEYIALNKAKKLPTPKPIQVSHIIPKEEMDMTSQMTEGQKKAVELFGDIVKIVEDDE